MKTTAQKTSISESRRHRWRKALLHLLRLTGFTLALLLLLALFHLIVLGIPDPLTRKFTERLQEKGIPVSIGAITLSPHRGWVLRDVRLYSPLPDDLAPLLSADKIYVRAWPKQWRGFLQSDWNLRMRSRRITVSPGRPWGPLAKPLFQTIQRASVDLQTEKQSVTITRANMSWGGVQAHARGTVSLETEPAGRRQSARSLKTMAASYDSIRSRIIQTAEVIAGFRFDTPPELSVQLDVPPNRTALSLQASVDAKAFSRYGRRIQTLKADVSFRNRTLQIKQLNLSQDPEHKLEMTGSLILDTRVAECRISNSLPAPDLFCLLRPDTANLLDNIGLQLPGALEFDAHLGPTPLPKLAETVNVDLRNIDLIRKDLSLTDLRGKVKRGRSRLELSKLQARANGGQLKGDALIDLKTKAWSASLEGAVDPGPIGTLLGGGAKNWIDRFDFTNQPPAMRIHLSHSGKKHALRMTGHLTGEDFTCTGLPIDTIDLSMAWSNQVFYLDSLHLTHNERQFDGSVDVNVGTRLATFKATSGLDPASIARILAPDHPTVLTRFIFNGPIQAEASGQVDYGNGTNHSFRGQFSAKDVVYNGYQVDTFKSLVTGTGSDLIFTNASARLFGGSATGSGSFDLRPKDGEAPYQISLEAKKVDFARVQAAIYPDSKARTTGELSGKINLTADGKTNIWESANGHGTVEIVGGRLADLPVLGEFSRLVRSTLPAFKLFSFTTLYADFQLRDGGLHANDLQLGGTLLTARAKGSYSPKEGLDFNVVTEPFRRTRSDKEWYHIHLWGAEAIKQGTAPLFKLLEFHLTGTLDKPKWNMKNFPEKKIPGIGKL